MNVKEAAYKISTLAKRYHISKPYLIGGIPRDVYMELSDVKTKDIDITTNNPDILRLGVLFAVSTKLPFNISEDEHLTVFADNFDVDFSSNFISKKAVEFLDNKDPELFEVYSRDFTINTLHQDLDSGEITDPTGMGMQDIDNKIIRTPVAAEITLTDDPRRIFRAIIFSVRYGFEIDSDIKKFVSSNPQEFGPGKVKEQFSTTKITEALNIDSEKTISLLTEMNLLKLVPLKGKFKEELMNKKLLLDYL